MDKLTTQESELLRKHEAVIKAGKNTFVLVGLALTEIRDKRLYRSEYGSFVEYCEKKWGWTHGRADQLVRAAAVVQSLTPGMDTMVSTERQARELAKVPPSKRAKVVKAASKNGPITARKIQEAAKPVVDADIIYRDELGYQIPKCCVEFWQRKAEIQELMTAVSRVKTAIEKGKAADDPLYFWVAQAAIDQLSRTYQFLTDAKPYAVCVYCQGTEVTREKCRACGGTGLVSKYGYEQRTDEKLRKMRDKQIEDQRRK